MTIRRVGIVRCYIRRETVYQEDWTDMFSKNIIEKSDFWYRRDGTCKEPRTRSMWISQYGNRKDFELKQLFKLFIITKIIQSKYINQDNNIWNIYYITDEHFHAKNNFYFHDSFINFADFLNTRYSFCYDGKILISIIFFRYFLTASDFFSEKKKLTK